MAGTFSKDGRDFYTTPEGKLVSVEAGFDVSTAYEGLAPATKDDVDARAYEKAAEAERVDPAFNRNAAGLLDPDAVFGATEPAPSVEDVEAFVSLPSTEPEVAKPFSRDGRDYFVAPDGSLHSVEAGFDAASEYDGLVPATAEQVRARDIQKRSGNLIDQVETFGHSAAATTLEAGTGLYNAVRDVTVDFYGPDNHVRPQDIAPFLYGDKEREQREANPVAAFLGAAVPDAALTLALPGGAAAGATRGVWASAVEGVVAGGPRAAAARILAQSVLTEAGDAVIEGHEFDMGTALGVWAPTQLVFEVGGGVLFGGVARGLGWSRDTLGEMVERSRSNAVKDALRETDPVKRSAKLAKEEKHIYNQAQTQLDEALAVIDEGIKDAPERLFTSSALKRSVSSNAKAQADAVLDTYVKLTHAAEVTDAPALKKAIEALDAVRGPGEAALFFGADGPALFKATREAWRVLDEAALDSPLAREVQERLQQTLGDEAVWGRAAKHHTSMLAEAGRAGGPVKHDVRNLTARDAIEARIEQARAMASLTGNKRLAKAGAEAAREALGIADEVTGARVMGGKATSKEIEEMRKTLDAFPERAPKVAAQVAGYLEALDDILPDTWTLERVETQIAGRAAGSKAVKAELDAAVDAAEAWIQRAKDAGDVAPGKVAKAQSNLNKLREALDEVDQLPKQHKAVRDFDSNPRNMAERVVDKLTGEVAQRVTRGIVGPVAGAATGFVGGGPIGAVVGGAIGQGLDTVIEPVVRKQADKFRVWAKEALRKGGKPAAGVAALYGANRLAYDEDDPSPNAAAGAALLGLPLFLSKGGKGAKKLLDAVRELDKVVTERGHSVNGWSYHDAAHELFIKDGSVVADALKKLHHDNVDVTGKEGARALKELVENGPTPFFKNSLGTMSRQQADRLAAEAEAKASRSKAKAGSSETVREARALLGDFGANIDGEFGHDWQTSNWRGTTTQTFGREGEPVAKVLKRRLADRAPLTLDEMKKDVLDIRYDLPPHLQGTGRYDAEKGEYILSDAALSWRAEQKRLGESQLEGLAKRVEEATAPLDASDRIGRVTAEDQVIRQVLRDALGMKSPKPPKPLDASKDATSRYRKNKKGFDAWAKLALDEPEHNALREWQSMRYRAINADTRLGRTGSKQSAEQLASEWQAQGMSKPDQLEKDVEFFHSKSRQQAANLISAMNKAIGAGQNVPGRVLRGISMPQDEVERLLKAKTVTAQGFMSTSIHDTTPKGFAERRAAEFKEVPVMLTVEQRTGLPIGQGEGELTLRPGTKFDVVWVEPANETDGVVTAYLREVEESKVTAADILKGIAGTIPTEAKVAGGLLALSDVVDDDDGDTNAAAAGVGGLGLLFGGKGKLRAINGRLSLLGRKIGSMAPALDALVDASDKQIQQIARWGQTAERGAFERAVDELKDHVEQLAIESAEGKAAIAAAEKVTDFSLGQLGDYVHAAVERRLATAASLETRAAGARVAPKTRQFVEERAQGSLSSMHELGRPGTGKQLENAAYTSLDRIPKADRDKALDAIDRADTALFGRKSDGTWQADIRDALRTGESPDALIKRYEEEAAAAVADHADGVVTPEMREYFRDMARMEIAQVVVRHVDPDIYARAANFPAMGLRVRAGLKSFVEEEGVDAAIRGTFPDAPILAGATKSPEEISAQRVKHLARWRGKLTENLRSYGANVPEPLDGHVVDDIFASMQRGRSIGEAVDEVVGVLDSGAEWVALDRDNHRHAKRAFDKWEFEASKQAGFNISSAISDYAGDWDYKNINAYSRGQLNAGGNVPNPSHDASSVKTGDKIEWFDKFFSEKIEWFENWVKGPDGDENLVDVVAMAKNGDEGALQSIDGWFESHGPKNLSVDDEIEVARARELDIRRAQEKAMKLQHSLDLAVSEGYTAPGVAYRGALMTDEHIALIAKAQAEGTEVEAHAFMSTTGNPDYALDFISRKDQLRENPDLRKTLFEVVQKTGVPINESETEILLRAGTRFRVEPVDRVIAEHMRAETRQHIKFRLVELDHDPKLPDALNKASALPWVAGGVLAIGAATEDEANGTAAAGAGLIGLAMLAGNKRRLGAWTLPHGMGSVSLDHVDDPVAHLIANGETRKAVLERVAQRVQAAERPLVERAISLDEHAAKAAEAEALWTPVQRAALDEYMVMPERANNHLRGIEDADDESEAVGLIVSALDDAVNAGATTPGIIYRGVNLAGKDFDKVEASALLMSQGILSGATNPERARIFAEAPGPHGYGLRVIYKIEQRTGVPVLGSGEEEVVMRPGTKFEIVGVDRARVGDRTFDMVEVREVGAVPEKSRRAFFKKHGGKIAGAAVLGGSLLNEDDANAAIVDQDEADTIIEQAKEQAASANAEREQALDETREKLGYLSHQGSTLMKTTARQLASKGGDDSRKVERMPGVTSSAGVARFLGDQATLTEAFQDKRKLLTTLQRDPMALVDELSESFAELQSNAPELHAHVTAQTFKVAKYLQSKLPSTIGPSLVRPEGSPPGQLEIRQFALFYSSATDPASVLTDLANNRARKEQLDTLRELWPETYQGLKVAVLDQLSQGRPTFAQRTRLDLLFDFGDGFDRALSPGLVAVLDAKRAAQGGPGGAGGPGGKQAPSRRSQPSVTGTGALGSLAMGAAGGPGTLA